MPKKIVILQGHPDNSERHLCHALAEAYMAGATGAGHEVTYIDVAALDFPLLASKKEWDSTSSPDILLEAQKALLEADHLVVLFPLWLGSLPAKLKGFFEQVFRPALAPNPKAWGQLMKGCSVRVIVTMGMPAFLYRLFFRAHGTKFFTRNVLAFSGCGPIRTSYIGLVENMTQPKADRWLGSMSELGVHAI